MSDPRNRPAKPVQAPRAVPDPEPDERSLSERATDAAQMRFERLRDEQGVRAEQEAADALGKLSVATGESPDSFERVLCMPDERGNWISLWWLEEDGFGFQVVRPAERRASIHVNLYDKCPKHGEFVVAQNIGVDIADLGDEIGHRDEWACPTCDLEEMPEEQREALEESPAEMVGNVILRAVTIAVLGKLEADKQEAMAEMREDE